MKVYFISLLLIGIGIDNILAKDWWEGATFYQIYPRSFKDSNGDGIGDLNGITEKLQYLKDIGMTGVWLSPIMKSPMADFGYDISDYYQIQPEYGTLEDFENLLKKAKEIGLKILLDFVPNHTSDEHEWFKNSVDGISPYEDYYVWHNGIYNEKTDKMDPPSNWLSAFRFSAWKWNDARQQYYLHQFADKQPDLNYRNPLVVEEMKDILRFWLKKGVSGFRIDAVPFLFEIEVDPITGKYTDEPVNPDCPDPNDYCHVKHIHTNDQPETYDMAYQWRELVDEFKKEYGGDTRILMTEAYTSLDNTIRFYGDGKRNGSHVPFNFELISNMKNTSTAVDFSKAIDSWLDKMPKGVEANWVMGNHDNKRLASRFGVNRADLLNMLLQTLPGCAVTYNGEELAMTDVYISWDDTVDPQACNTDPDRFHAASRDPARTPFQWDSSNNAGFSTGSDTWLPVSADYKKNNVLMQTRSPVSHLNVFKKLTKLRREPSFQEGTLEKTTNGNNVLIYKREKVGSEIYIIILNFGKTTETINLKELFSNISNKVEIITTSIQSSYTDGEIVDANSFKADAEVGTVIVAL